MPWISQMIGFALLFLGIAVALWISFWVLLIVFGIGVCIVIWSHLKDFLLKKGILNPTPGRPQRMDGGEGIIIDAEVVEKPTTLIEGEYKKVDPE